MKSFIQVRGSVCALTLFAACVSLFPSDLSAQISIFRPKFGVPVFPLTNGAFQAEIQAAPGLASNGWSILLLNDLRSWTCSLERVEYGYYVYCNSTTGYQLTVRTPADAPPDTFKLRISHSVAGTTTNRHCVRILPAYETNFYILHYADPQVETDNATAANGAGGSHGSVQAMNWASSVYSLINPRFMFDTGDEVENGVASFYPKYLDAADAIGSPLLVTRGNNDYGSFADWKRDIGQPTYSITMGSFYVVMKDYNASENNAWFTNDYAQSFANTNIKYRLFGQHYNSGGSAYAPAAGQYPDLMLVGHGHTFTTVSSSPYYVLESGPGWNYGAVGIFEFFKSGTTWVCSNKTIHGGANALYVYGDWGNPRKLTNTFAYANNGTVFTNTTYITNSLNYDFWDGRVRFLMRQSAAGYSVSGGEKIDEYDYNGTNTAVLVKVNIRRNAQTTVTVSPTVTDTTPPLMAFRLPTNAAVFRTSQSNLVLVGTVTESGAVTSLTYSVSGAVAGSGSPVTGLIAFVSAGATWKYLDNGSDQGTAWRALGFNDSSWASGPAELGYGDGDEATVNGYGPDLNNKYVTTYYRSAFNIADRRVFTNALSLQVVRDDGILVFLNGQEAYRNFLPAGNVAYNMLASGAVPDETTWQSQSVSVGALSNGANTVAAEIHQAAINSTDISFNLALGTDLGNSWLITNIAFATGTSLVQVTARDASGNTSTSTLSVIVTGDADDDGMDDAWEGQYFGASGAVPDGDDDTDTLNNVEEYIAGTDPTNRASVFAMDSRATGTNFMMTFTSLDSRLYDVVFKTNLLAGDWQVLTNDVEGTGGLIQIRDSVTNATRYYRLRVQMH